MSVRAAGIALVLGLAVGCGVAVWFLGRQSGVRAADAQAAKAAAEVMADMSVADAHQDAITQAKAEGVAKTLGHRLQATTGQPGSLETTLQETNRRAFKYLGTGGTP